MKYNYTSVHYSLWKDAQELLSALLLYFFFRLNLHILNSQLVLLLQRRVLFACFWRHTTLFQLADIQKGRPRSSQISFKWTSFFTL